MDRRLPTVSKHVLRASVVSVASWSLAPVALAVGEMESQAIPVPGAASGASGAAGGWVSMLVAMAGFAVAGCMWWRRARRAGAARAGAIEVIDRTGMGGGRSLALVRVGDRVVLVGESAQGFQRLAEFDAQPGQDIASCVAPSARRLAS